MNILTLLFVAFILVPLGEIYLLIEIGGRIGALPTIGLVVLTALLGSWMLRQQGLATLQRARLALDSGITPTRELVEGLLLLIGGILLLTPGFVTDMAGFVCLLPLSRSRVADYLLKHLLLRVRPRTSPTTTQADPRIIEGEWQREDSPDDYRR